MFRTLRKLLLIGIPLTALTLAPIAANEAAAMVLRSHSEKKVPHAIASATATTHNSHAG